MMFPTAAVQFHVLTHSIRGFLFLHIFNSYCVCVSVSVLMAVRCYLIVTVICIPPMITNGSFHGLIGRVHIFFGEMFQSLARVLVGLFHFVC